MEISNDIIQDYLQQWTITSLVQSADSRMSPDHFLKVGLLPFIRRAGLYYYVMKPRADHKDLSPPEFQICKGTRMHYIDGLGWRDMKEGMPTEDRREMLIETALREGVEELGIVLENIVGLFDLGAYSFTSASTGKPKKMWLFAAEVIEASDFLPGDKVENTTAERKWLSADEFLKEGRPDHKPILEKSNFLLCERLKV